jgi:WD40 repeat protein
MDEESLRAMLADALAGEPPIGPVSRRALRAGVRLRRRYRAGTASGFAVVAGIAVALPLALHSPSVSPAGPAARPPVIRERAGGMGGHRDIPLRVSFSPAGQILVTADNDGTARLWSVPAEHQLGAPIGRPGVHIRDAAFSLDGKVLVTVNTAGTAQFWDVANRNLLATISASSKKLLTVAFSPNGKILATAGADGSIRLWNVATLRQVGPAMTSPGSSVGGVIFSPDGKLLAASQANGTVQLWSVVTHRPVGKPIGTKYPGFALVAAAFSPNGKILATAGQDLREWSVATQRQIGPTIHPGRYDTNGVVFTPDGTTIITANAGDLIQEWNVATLHEEGSISPAGHTNNFSSAVISPDGKFLATTSYSGPARLFQLTG